jgi:organic hydroperoxide reductase OsmC/OhrA
MTEHHARIEWKRSSDDFSYPAYSRDHSWKFKGGVTVPASAAPKYLGSPNRIDPEEAFVAALSSCHMLSFLAIASRKRVVVDSYDDEAIGFLEENAAKKLVITRVILRPKVIFGTPVDRERAEKMHHEAHEQCFIANSVKTDVRCEAIYDQSTYT